MTCANKTWGPNLTLLVNHAICQKREDARNPLAPLAWALLVRWNATRQIHLNRSDHECMAEKTCPYCGKGFHPSRYHPDQEICEATRCQRRRRTDYHRKKMAEDPSYREQCRDSQKHWREHNRAYMKHYRQGKRLHHKQQQESIRSLGEFVRLLDVVKNNVAPNLTKLSIDVWLMPSNSISSVKNTFARTQVIVVPADIKGVLYTEA